VVFVVSITGCIFCFQDEIQDAVHNYRHVEVQNKPYLLPSVLRQNGLLKYPGDTVNYIYYYGKDRPAAVLVNTKQGLQDVFLDPYTGVITHTENPLRNFFTVVEYIHLYLLLPANIGTIVVGTSVIIFVAIMISGIILWWPKRKTDRKRSFTIKWNGRWRRVNYDLHNVLGFYATSIALVLAITGLAMAFELVNKGLYYAANMGKDYPKENSKPHSDTTAYLFAKQAIDRAFKTAQQRSPTAEMFLIYDPSGKTETIQVTAYSQTLHYGNSDIFYFDRYTGKLLKTLTNAQKSTGKKLNELNYDIHVGQALGLTGKIIAFLASLVCASLPVTGFVIWLSKRKKKQAIDGKVGRASVHNFKK
jgi:uncharacterized iron-regulated membrane protein